MKIKITFLQLPIHYFTLSSQDGAHRMKSKFNFGHVNFFLALGSRARGERNKNIFCIINHTLPEVSQLPCWENSIALTHP